MVNGCVCGGDGQRTSEGEERTRLRTRSRSRAVRISFKGVELDPAKETSTVFEEEPSTEAPEPSSAPIIGDCKYCGE